jgi:hypothetical protein
LFVAIVKLQRAPTTGFAAPNHDATTRVTSYSDQGSRHAHSQSRPFTVNAHEFVDWLAEVENEIAASTTPE